MSNKLSFFGKNKIVAVKLSTSNEVDSSLNSNKLVYRFSNFERPSNLDSNAVNIFLDNNFLDFLPEDNIIFLDHHLHEENKEPEFNSNVSMMVVHYREIFEIVNKILKSLNDKNVHVYIHQDLDGICSGLVFKHMYNCIKNYLEPTNYEYDLKFTEILGRYGDIDPNAKVQLTTLFSNEKEIDIYDKKFSVFCKKIGRFMKATRGYINNFENGLVVNESIYEDFKMKIDKYKINNKSVNRIYDTICERIEQLDVVNTQSVVMFFNLIVQDPVFKTVLELYETEVAEITSNYTNPTIPAFEMSIVFKNDPTNTPYKLLIINTSLDCGRSVIWKYRTVVNTMLKQGAANSPWYYKITDWKKEKNLVKENENIICYNKMLNKVSFDSSNNSGYTIASDVFNGGGHSQSIVDSRSIGSASVSSEQEFLNSFRLLNFY